MQAFFKASGLPEIYRCEFSKSLLETFSVVNKTQEQWYAEGAKNIFHGFACFLYGIIFQILYIPCLLVFPQRDLFKNPAYKFMFLIALRDLLNLTTDSTFHGIFLIEGAVYCNRPLFFYIWGCIQTSSFAGGCLTCFFLTLSRLVDVLSGRLHDKLFKGKRLVFTFLIIFAYTLMYYLYMPPLLFNSKAEIWLWDPLVQTDGSNYEKYASILAVVNNVGTVGLTLLLSIWFIICFVYKMKTTYNFSMKKAEMQILLQSCVLCLNNCIVCFIFLCFLFMPPSMIPTLTSVSLISWQLSSGCAVIVFYGLNKTVRTRVFELFNFDKLLQKKISVHPNSGTGTI